MRPGSLEGQPVLLSLGVGRTLREERCTVGAWQMPNGIRQVMNGRAVREAFIKETGAPLGMADRWVALSCKIMIRSIVIFAQGGRTVRSVVGYCEITFEQTQKKPLSLDKGFSEFGPGSVLLSHGETPHYHRR